MSKPTRNGDVEQLALWLPATLLAAVAERAREEGINQRQAVTEALVSWVSKGWMSRAGGSKATGRTR